MNPDPPKRVLPPIAVSDEALRWIVKLHSGAATAADRKAFHDWRAAHPEHEAAAQEAESLWGDATNLHQDPATGIIRPGRRKRAPNRRNVITGVAAISAFGGSLWAAGVLREWTADYATGIGETRTITLPDGSRITLNARSAVNLGFSPSERRIALVEGQAFFEVAPDSMRPFQVTTKGVAVTALGTAFDVNTDLEGGGVAVSVTEHAVTVAAGAPATSVPAASIKLLAGQSVVVDPLGRIGPVTQRPPSVTTAWRTGMYIAEDRSLGDVVAALRPYHAGRIMIRGNIATTLHVNAVLNLKAPDDSLDALANGLPISVRRLSPYLVVISSAE